MLKNYFKIAWRNIVKNRFYSVVNILGLSVGIAFTLLITAYVWSEWHVNKNLKHLDRQYILQSKWKDPNEGIELATIGALAKSLKENYPTLVANFFRFDGIYAIISKNDKSFREDLAIGDSTILNMYGFTLLYGNPSTALNDPFAIVITSDEAIKYFGKTDVVGQSLTIENFSGSRHDFIITGVMKPPPRNSVTRLNDANDNRFYVSTSNLNFFSKNDMSWQNPYIAGFIELQKGVSPADLEKPMARLIKQNAPPQFNADLKPYLVPLKSYYLVADNGLVKKMLYTLSAIALFILLMAIINFINMSVSRSAARMREIGIRKVLGSLKKQLILQFLVESVIIVFLATIFSFVLYVVSKNLFCRILNSEIPSLKSFDFYFVCFPLLLILIVGFIAGIYPAFILSSLKSVESLKGKLSSIKDSVLLRKSLIAFQFGTAIVSLVGAIIIAKQINLFLSKNLGYNKDYIVSSQVPRDWSSAGVDRMITIRNQFMTMPSLQNVALSYEIPDGNNAGQTYVYNGTADSSKAIPMQVLQTDENYSSVYLIAIKAGSFFEGKRSDSATVILNETALHALGWNKDADAVGKLVHLVGDPTNYTVKGVTGDFHFGSMQQKIAPIIFFNVQFSAEYRFLSFKVEKGNIASTINKLQKKWMLLMPGEPFEFTFMDVALARLYESEIQLKKASYAATFLALVIVLLGVLGLISLSIQKRTREIGIRKVLGSSVTGIVSLFIREFLGVIAVAGIVACPAAYFIMHFWLQNYAYRVSITPVPFFVAITALGAVTVVLIWLQTVKAALTNPVKSLRTE